MLKIVPVLFLLIFLNGCGSKLMFVAPVLEDIAVPESHKETVRNVGDVVLERSRVYNISSVKIVSNIPDVAVGKYEMTAYFYDIIAGNSDPTSGPVVSDKKIRIDIYSPVAGSGAIIPPNSALYNRMYLFYNTESGKLYKGFFDGYGYPVTTGELPPYSYYIKVDYSERFNNFTQTLMYTGREGDVVKFSYREFSNFMARPAYTVDVSYNLNDGNEITFRDARLKILNASNKSITYIVLNHFPLIE